MKTEFGDLTLKSVRAKIIECNAIGETQFVRRYANGRGARSTWIDCGGELYPAKAIFAAALRPTLAPRDFNTSDTYVFARLLGFSSEIGLQLVRMDDGIIESGRSAINDLDDLNGPQLPMKQEYAGARYVRNGKVRRAVLARAKGRCEHCGGVGFITSSGQPYLETHHIISLAKQGPDSMSNVIALCPLDHRRAHFAEDSMELEVTFQSALERLQAQ